LQMARITPPELIIISISLLMLSLETVIALQMKDQQSEKPKNLMKEYMIRGMLQCTATYVETIAELQKHIEKAYMEHIKCQEDIEHADKNYPKLEFSILDELQDSWREEDSAV
ncbi:hypothetical protein PENTCL1PPCAC_12610, partial [Pristionchus entomophagus]